MADNALWVGILTAVTALGGSLGASLLTSRGNTKVAREQALVSAHAGHIAEARNRRRDAYRELIARVHDLSQIFWRMDEVDQAATEASREAILREIRVASRLALNGVEKVTQEVLLEGPPEVSKLAGELDRAAVRTHYYLTNLTVPEVTSGAARDRYQNSYKGYEGDYNRFVERARHALEISDPL